LLREKQASLALDVEKQKMEREITLQDTEQRLAVLERAVASLTAEKNGGERSDEPSGRFAKAMRVSSSAGTALMPSGTIRGSLFLVCSDFKQIRSADKSTRDHRTCSASPSLTPQ
jgi:hypothetical protein